MAQRQQFLISSFWCICKFSLKGKTNLTGTQGAERIDARGSGGNGRRPSEELAPSLPQASSVPRSLARVTAWSVPQPCLLTSMRTWTTTPSCPGIEVSWKNTTLDVNWDGLDGYRVYPDGWSYRASLVLMTHTYIQTVGLAPPQNMFKPIC